MPDRTLTLVLAAERGPGLDPLTLHRPKAAVPFGGKYRAIDFTLANCLHSGLRQVLVLTQYKSHSLHKHLRDGWGIFNPELGEYITTVPAQQREGLDWYAGPVDAIRQNRYLIERSPAERVLVLEGGAIYRMDYAELIRAHRDCGVQATLAVRGARDPGSGRPPAATLDGEGRVLALAQPGMPAAGPEPEPEPLTAMGVYCFDKVWLLALLERPAGPSGEPGSGADQGARGLDLDLGIGRLAPLLGETRVQGYRFGEARGRVTPDRYWCDLGSIDAYYQANMALLRAEPPMDLYQADWNIRTYPGQYPPARTVPGKSSGTEGIFVNSMLASGTVIVGGGVNHCVLFAQVRVGDGAIVDTSILFDGVVVGEGAHLRDCIVEKEVRIPPGERIGLDPARDRGRFPVSAGGIVVVPKGYRF
jgi:glucose-1-phosphate adenylyltransferase